MAGESDVQDVIGRVASVAVHTAAVAGRRERERGRADQGGIRRLGVAPDAVELFPEGVLVSKVLNMLYLCWIRTILLSQTTAMTLNGSMPYFFGSKVRPPQPPLPPPPP